MVDLDTFMVAVYTLVDDLYQRQLAPRKPRRRGAKPVLSDSEVLTLMLLGQWVGNSQRALLRHAASTWSGYFPRQLSQSAFNRRSRDLGSTCVHLMHLIAGELEVARSPYQIIDTTPVPVARLCRGKHHRLFAEDAAIGRGGSDKHFYYGCVLLLALADTGAVTGFVVGPANTEGRWLCDALLGWRADPTRSLRTRVDLAAAIRRRPGGYVGPTGPRWWPDSVGIYTPRPYIADAGFTGQAWLPHWQRDAGASVLPPLASTIRVPPDLRRSHRRWRQLIETVNAMLAGVLHLAYPQAKTPWGIMTRIAAKCAAFNAGIWLNRWLGRPDLAIATLFSG